MFSHKAFRFRAAPTSSQASHFARFASVCRAVYNCALEQRERHYEAYKRSCGKVISYNSQAKELTLLRAEFDWLKNVSQTCQQQALKDLDQAYQRFYKGVGGRPTVRKRGAHESFRFMGRECRVEQVNARFSKVKLPKIGWVKFRQHRPLRGRILNVTVIADVLGWHITFGCEVETIAPPAPNHRIGIDRGIAITIATSDDDILNIPKETLHILDRRIRKQQRAISRCNRGSNRRRRLVRRVAKNKAKQARIKKHFNHVQSKRIAERANIVVLEDLKTGNMTRSAKGTLAEPGKNVKAKSGLNRAILNNNWHQFETFLSYKLQERGGELIKVNPAYTSQTCSKCGTIDKHHRKSQAVFECGDCGHKDNADINAAKNILKAGTQPTTDKAALAA